jgi:hypothetical protein
MPLFSRPFTIYDRITLIHITFFLLLAFTFHLSNSFETSIFGPKGVPCFNFNWIINPIARLSGQCEKWCQKQDDLLELRRLYQLVVCAGVGWVTWTVVGERTMSGYEDEEGLGEEKVQEKEDRMHERIGQVREGENRLIHAKEKEY